MPSVRHWRSRAFDPLKDDWREDGLSIDVGGNIDDAGVIGTSLFRSPFPVVCSLAHSPPRS